MQKTKFISKSLQALFVAGAAMALSPLSANAGNVPTQAVQSTNQAKVIKGHVVDKDGEPLIGVTVMSTTSKSGTVTDVNGDFSYDASKGTLVNISYAGYKSQKVNVREGIVIQLEPDLVGLEDVVVVGYGTVKKKDLTGAVASMKSEDITISPTPNAMEALQGKVAGLDITKTSGSAGSSVSILLRGSRSIYGDNAPLFIIDGVQGGSFEDINPNDIESIDVLKDASSTAIYGSAGANGVIIITTKRGKEGKARVTFDAYYGVSGQPNFQHGMTGDEWMTYQRSAYLYSHDVTSVDDASLFGNSDYLQAYQAGKWIDWVDQIKNTATQQKYAMSVSGGTQKTKIFASASYNKIDGIIETDNKNQYQMRLNIDQELNKWLTASFTSNLNYSNLNNGNKHTFTDALTALPLGDPYDENGNINYIYIPGKTTPLGDYIENQYAENVRTTQLNLNGSLTWTPFKGVSAKTSLSAILSHARNGKYRGDEADATHPSYASTPFAESSNTNKWVYNWENIISYNKEIGDHTFGIQGISSYIVNEQEYARAYSNGIAMDAYQWHQLKGGDSKSYSEYKKWQKLSYAVRFNYSYQDKYLLNVSNRWDGVSWFAEGKKWDTFPAVAIGWRITEEKFMEGTKSWLDNLKLRVGYGITGNAGMLSTTNETGLSDGNAYATQSVPYYFSGTGMRDGERVDVIQYNSYGSSTLGWEKSYNWNIGLDFAFINSRISGSIEYFNTKTKGLLYKQQIPITAGITMWGSPITTWQNLAETANHGIELTLNTQNIRTKDFTWNTTLTGTWAKEKVLSIPNSTTGYYLDTTNGKNIFVGEPISSLYGYKYLGIWTTAEATEAAKYGAEPGFIKVATNEKDGDGGVHTYGTDDRQVLGHSNPDWILGLTNNFTYKNFDLSIHMMARLGQTIKSDMLGRYTASSDITVNQISGADYWVAGTNEGAYYPRPGSYSKQTTVYESLCYVDGSFFKVKNITLGYTLPEKLVKKAFMERVRFYVTAYNPWIVCNSLLKDTDPETGGSDAFPTYKEYVFGVNVTF